MCGRFAFYSPGEAVVRLFGVSETPPMLPRYNLAPTQFVVAIRQLPDAAPAVSMLRWGLVPSWAKDRSIGNKLINARGETTHSKPSFRSAFRKQRCLILADGFYEWRAEGSVRQPYYITLQSGEPFAMAGLWESHDDGVGDAPLNTCTIITTEPNPMMSQLHRRMPVILPAAARDSWLDPSHQDIDALRSVLVPFAGDMTFRAVGREVNSPRNDGPELLLPASANAQPGLLDELGAEPTENK
ncbi:MAG: SOS response-associated peptidase [Gammaproteobacteria bacterium]